MTARGRLPLDGAAAWAKLSARQQAIIGAAALDLVAARDRLDEAWDGSKASRLYRSAEKDLDAADRRFDHAFHEIALVVDEPASASSDTAPSAPAEILDPTPAEAPAPVEIAVPEPVATPEPVDIPRPAPAPTAAPVRTVPSIDASSLVAKQGRQLLAILRRAPVEADGAALFYAPVIAKRIGTNEVRLQTILEHLESAGAIDFHPCKLKGHVRLAVVAREDQPE